MLDPGGDEPVGFGPVHLQRTARQTGEAQEPIEGTGVGGECHGVAIGEAEFRGIGRIDVHGVTTGAGERVDIAEHHRIELLAAARGDGEQAGCE